MSFIAMVAGTTRKRRKRICDDKYKYLMARNLINTAEDFIERAATESSFTGQPYQVRCNGGATVPSNQWLRYELVRFRMFK